MDNDDEHVGTPEQFRTRLESITSRTCSTHEEIDDALREFLEAVVSFHNEHEELDRKVDHGCYELLSSNLFTRHRHYVRRQFIHSLLEDDDYATLQILTNFLLLDGERDEDTYLLMQEEGLFPRLVQLIQSGAFDETRVHALLLELLAETTRIKQLSREDLKCVNEGFILYLFKLVEQQSSDPGDPYHSAIIRVLLVLNEQYMCFNVDSQQDDGAKASAAGPAAGSGQRHAGTSSSLPNRIVQVLSDRGPTYRTFGENLILLLNRESSLGPQLLILKMLYLLFTTARTYEYFYTNDLYVLVDVILRNLLDLDPGIAHDEDGNEAMDLGSIGQRALRHTYLRVLFPLLRNTQLAREGTNYKRDELRRTLRLLASSSSLHFAPADVTVVNLVSRCRKIDWIREDDYYIEHMGAGGVGVGVSSASNQASHSQDGDYEVEPSPVEPSPTAMTDADVAKKLLGMNNVEASLSRLSVLEVTAKVEKEEQRQLDRRSGSSLFSSSDKDSRVSDIKAGKSRPEVPPPRRMVKKMARLATFAAPSPHLHQRADARTSKKASGLVSDDVDDGSVASAGSSEDVVQQKVKDRVKPVLPKPRRMRSEQVGPAP